MFALAKVLSQPTAVNFTFHPSFISEAVRIENPNLDAILQNIKLTWTWRELAITLFLTVNTYLAKPGEITRSWHLIDATDQVLGRLAVRIANLIRGRHKATYTPHIDTGDFVIVINADKVAVTGRKEVDKTYMFYTGWMGNEWYRSLQDFRQKNPTFIIRHAVKGMLPKNRLARQMLTKLKIYAGPDHPHAARQPTPLHLS